MCTAALFVTVKPGIHPNAQRQVNKRGQPPAGPRQAEAARLWTGTVPPSPLPSLSEHPSTHLDGAGAHFCETPESTASPTGTELSRQGRAGPGRAEQRVARALGLRRRPHRRARTLRSHRVTAAFVRKLLPNKANQRSIFVKLFLLDYKPVLMFSDICCGWVLSPPNSFFEVLTPRSSEGDLIWKEGHCRCNWLR